MSHFSLAVEPELPLWCSNAVPDLLKKVFLVYLRVRKISTCMVSLLWGSMINALGSELK